MIDKSKIVLAQFYTENVKYGNYTEEINRKYCEESGYTYIVEKNTKKIISGVEGRAVTWYKPKLILEILEQLNPEYILFLDIDAAVVDFSIPIEQFIDDGYDMVFTHDYSAHSRMNAGVFLLKNTPWVKAFLQQWWESANQFKGEDCIHLSIADENKKLVGYYKNGLWHDQTCLSLLYEQHKEVKEKIKLIDFHSLNWMQPFDGNFVYHGFAYGINEYRLLDKVHDKIFNGNDDIFSFIRR